jgi:hypothetical protein
VWQAEWRGQWARILKGDAGQHIVRRLQTMVYSVKQLTDGYCCITEWQRSDFTWPFLPGEQKKLKRLTLNQRVLGSSPRGLTTPGRNGSESFRSLFMSSRTVY